MVKKEEPIMSEQVSCKQIGVLLVEDDQVTRKTLCLAIESEPSLRLLAAHDSVQPALEWLSKSKPDVLLTDLGLPDGHGIDVIRECVRRYPRCDIMVITMSSDEESVLACIEAGASGYVLKGAGKTDIARAVLDLRSGGAPMSPAIARMVLAKVRHGRRTGPGTSLRAAGAANLTKKEAAILDLIAQGDSYGEVAKMLSVSVGTVQTHIKNIYGKLSVHSRGEAVFEAHRRGWLKLGSPREAK